MIKNAAGTARHAAATAILRLRFLPLVVPPPAEGADSSFVGGADGEWWPARNGTAARLGVPSSTSLSSVPAEGSRNGSDTLFRSVAGGEYVAPAGEATWFSTGGILLLLSFLAIHGGSSDVCRWCMDEDAYLRGLHVKEFLVSSSLDGRSILRTTSFTMARRRHLSR